MLCPAVASSQFGTAQESASLVGRKVMVVRSGAKLKSLGKVAGIAVLGQVYTVSHVNGEWL